MEISILKDQLQALPASEGSKTDPKNLKNSIKTDLDRVKTLAKKFTALCEPFSRIYNDPNLFALPRPSADCLQPKIRFSGDLVARRDGWLAYLYDEGLPEDLHPMVKGYSDFDAEVHSNTFLLSRLTF